MGDILVASCRCGFKEEFTAGGGKLNYNTYCGAPAYCPKCSSFLVLNYLGKKKVCPKCHAPVIFYDNPTLQAPMQKASGTIFGWNLDVGAFRLPNTSYKCPKCGEFSLHFESVGNFD